MLVVTYLINSKSKQMNLKVVVVNRLIDIRGITESFEVIREAGSLKSLHGKQQGKIYF
jgi:hypothetical protein